MGIIIVWMGKSMEESSKMVCEWADDFGLMILVVGESRSLLDSTSRREAKSGQSTNRKGEMSRASR